MSVARAVILVSMTDLFTKTPAEAAISVKDAFIIDPPNGQFPQMTSNRYSLGRRSS